LIRNAINQGRSPAQLASDLRLHANNLELMARGEQILLEALTGQIQGRTSNALVDRITIAISGVEERRFNLEQGAQYSRRQAGRARLLLARPNQIQIRIDEQHIASIITDTPRGARAIADHILRIMEQHNTDLDNTARAVDGNSNTLIHDLDQANLTENRT
jgi:hypothetical protein